MDKLIKIVMLLLLSAAFSFAKWTGETREPVVATANDVVYYKISTPEELAWLAAKVNGGDSIINAQLTNDIVLWDSELSEESEAPRWTPIGKSENECFSGIFDGQNHTISGLYVNDTLDADKRSLGLFGFVCANGTVQNLNVENSLVDVYIDGKNSYRDSVVQTAGGLTGWNFGKLLNVSFSGSVKIGSVVNDDIVYAEVGGIAAHNHGTISRAVSKGEFLYSGNGYFRIKVGGIAGYNDSLIQNSSNEAFVFGEIAGGIAGESHYPARIDSCVNSGTVKVDANEIFRSYYAGGIAGYVDGGAFARNCVNNGEVLFGGDYSLYVGGLFGEIDSEAEFDSCTNNGNVKGVPSDVVNAGGFAGRITSASLNEIQNNGDILIDSAYLTCVGGIAGFAVNTVIVNSGNKGSVVSHFVEHAYMGGAVGDSYDRTRILNFSNEGVVETHSYSSSYVGGIVGRVYESESIENSRNIASVSGVADKFGSSSYVGGIAGYISTSKGIKGNLNEGKVSGFAKSLYIGGIVGEAYLETVLDSCVNKGNVETLEADSGFVGIGGIAGYALENIAFRKCTNSGNISFSGEDPDAGGIVGGMIRSVKIDSCTNEGEVKGKTLKYAYVGGITGFMYDDTEVNYVQNKGNVSVEGGDSSKVGGIIANVVGLLKISNTDNSGALYASSHENVYLGGIVGFVRDSADVSGVHNSGLISANSEGLTYAGGIFGFIYTGGIKAAENKGDVKASGESFYLGGIAGLLPGGASIDSSVNSGSIETPDEGHLFFAGGLVGYALNVRLRNCTNNGNMDLSGELAYAGGAIGMAASSFMVDSCVNNGDVKVSVTESSFVGGFVGGGFSQGDLNYVRNNGHVSMNAIFSSPRSAIAGGLAGVLGGNINVLGFWNGGAVDLTVLCESCAAYAGGIAGNMEGTVRESANTGRIFALSNGSVTFAGGLFGLSTNSIFDSYNTANVIATAKINVYIGGIAGTASGDEIKSTFSLADSVFIESESSVDSVCKGALVGNLSSTGSIRSLYYKHMNGDLEAFGTLPENFSDIKNVGEVTEEEMQSDVFAWYLNSKTGTESNSGKWSRVDGYPIFADESHLPIYRVTFDVDVEDSVQLTDYEGSLVWPDVSDFAEGKTLAFWVNQDGKEFDVNEQITEDAVLSPVFADASGRYKVTFMLSDTEAVATYLTGTDGRLKYIPGDPTLSGDSVFSGWRNSDDEFINTATVFTQDDSVVAVYNLMYTITFNDADGTTLYETEVLPGEIPQYEGNTPHMLMSDKYVFSFIDWNSEILPATGNAIYTAVYDSTLRYFYVQFMNDTEVVKFQYVEYGAAAEEPEPPVRQGAKFVEWDKNFDMITEDLVVNAVFVATDSFWVVVYEDGQRKSLDFLSGNSTFTLPNVSSVDGFTFVGWYDSNGKYLGKPGDEIIVVADTLVRSGYVINTYLVTFLDELGFEMAGSYYNYGDVPVLPENPSKAPTAEYTYYFAGWSPSVTKVTEDVVYKPVFTSVPRKYDVAFYSREGVLLDEQKVLYDSAAVAPEAPAEKGWVFVGWDKTFDHVGSDMDVRAVYEKEKFDVAEFGKSSSSNANSSSSYRNPFHLAGKDAVAGVSSVPQFSVEIIGRNVHVGAARVGAPYALMDVQGHAICSGYVDAANFNIAIPNAGAYLVRVGGQISRVTVK